MAPLFCKITFNKLGTRLPMGGACVVYNTRIIETTLQVRLHLLVQ